MKTARRSSWEQGIRINYVAPCWIKSAIRTKEYESWLMAQGIEFGEQADCAGCMMRIACDKSINGTCYSIIALSTDQSTLPSGLMPNESNSRSLAHDHTKIQGSTGVH
jgi:hypothetical protein